LTDKGELVFYVKLHVRPERVGEWKRAVFEIIERMSKEDAFVACYLQQDSEDANLFTLYERWREPTVEAFIEHQMKPYRLEYEAKLPALLQRPREAAVLTPLGEWRKAGE
jgi:quinol monooxygenase YgiN